MIPMLYEQMRTYNHLGHPSVFFFKASVDNILSAVDLKNQVPLAEQKTLRNLSTKLETNIRDLVSSYATNIRDGNYDNTLQAMQENYDLVQSKVPEMIRQAYGKEKNRLDQILPFVRSITKFAPYSDFLDALVDIMVSSRDIYSSKGLELISEIERLRTFHQLNYGVKIIIDNMARKLPSSLKFIIGEPSCQIYNEEFQQRPLFAASKMYKYDLKLRNVYLTNEDGCVKHNSDKWNIIPVDFGRYFLIRNVEYEEYLHAPSNRHYRYDKQRRGVFTWEDTAPFSNGIWLIGVANDGKVEFKNQDYSEYLYAGDNTRLSIQYNSDYGEKLIFTRTQNNTGHQPSWRIKC